MFSFGQTFTVINDLTMPTKDTVMATINLPDLEEYQYDVGVTVEWYGAAGTLNGQINIQRSIVDSLKVTMDTATYYIDIDAANSYGYIKVSDVTANKLYLKLDLNSLTAGTGTINAWATVKRKR